MAINASATAPAASPVPSAALRVRLALPPPETSGWRPDPGLAEGGRFSRVRPPSLPVPLAAAAARSPSDVDERGRLGGAAAAMAASWPEVSRLLSALPSALSLLGLVAAAEKQAGRLGARHSGGSPAAALSADRHVAAESDEGASAARAAASAAASWGAKCHLAVIQIDWLHGLCYYALHLNQRARHV